MLGLTTVYSENTLLSWVGLLFPAYKHFSPETFEKKKCVYKESNPQPTLRMDFAIRSPFFLLQVSPFIGVPCPNLGM